MAPDYICRSPEHCCLFRGLMLPGTEEVCVNDLLIIPVYRGREVQLGSPQVYPLGGLRICSHQIYSFVITKRT